MRVSKVSAAGIVICGTLAVPGAALAQDPGVHFDSGSPAGKEYAIPLAEGRAEGAGTKNQRAAADMPFGVGIRPPGNGDGSGGRGGSGSGGGPVGSGTTGGNGSQGASDGAERSGAGRRGASRGAEGSGSKRPAVDEEALSNAEAPVDTTGRTLGIAFGVLAAGAALGLLFWWRRQQPAA